MKSWSLDSEQRSDAGQAENLTLLAWEFVKHLSQRDGVLFFCESCHTGNVTLKVPPPLPKEFCGEGRGFRDGSVISPAL